MNTNTKKPSESPVISCQSREQLRDASNIIRKISSEIAFIRDEGMAVIIQGLDIEALEEEYLMDVIRTSPGGSGLSAISSLSSLSSLMDTIMSSPSGSGLSEISSPLQLGWRSEVSDIDSSPTPTPTPITSWLSLEDSARSNTDQEDRGYDADISSNCDHSASAESV